MSVKTKIIEKDLTIHVKVPPEKLKTIRSATALIGGKLSSAHLELIVLGAQTYLKKAK